VGKNWLEVAPPALIFVAILKALLHHDIHEGGIWLKNGV